MKALAALLLALGQPAAADIYGNPAHHQPGRWDAGDWLPPWWRYEMGPTRARLVGPGWDVLARVMGTGPLRDPATVERILGSFDRDGDGRLSAAEGRTAATDLPRALDDKSSRPVSR